MAPGLQKVQNKSFGLLMAPGVWRIYKANRDAVCGCVGDGW